VTAGKHAADAHETRISKAVDKLGRRPVWWAEMEGTKVALAADSCGVGRGAMTQNGARRYGERASDSVRTEVRRRADALGIARVARDLGVSTEAVVRTIAGLQQAPGTLDRIAAKLQASAF
jgi:hypothetical protein